ncbi:MAG: DUF2807 domain-containing protein [Clostridia bacterium]|nr:DUF2807 domain-containing protein [Clostridia bacterium]
MKKMLAITLVLALMCLTLTACGTPRTELTGDGLSKTINQFLDGNTYTVEIKGISLLDNTAEQEYVSVVLDSTIGNQIDITGDTNIIDTLTITKDVITDKIIITGSNEYTYGMTTQIVITIGAEIRELILSGNFGLSTPNFNSISGFRLSASMGGVAGYINFGVDTIDNFDMRLTMAVSELTMVGTCTNFSTTAIGEVKLHAYDLSVTNATIKTNMGSSIIEVDVTDALSFTTDDGVCTYEGTPSITQEITGAGSISARVVEP